MSGRRQAALWALAVAIAVVGEAGFLGSGFSPFGEDVAFAFWLDVAVGFGTMAAGILTWSRRPRNRIGPMLFAAGAAWSLSGVFAFGLFSYVYGVRDLAVWRAALVVIGGVLVPLHYSILVHLLLAYPEGRLHSRLEQVLVIGLYALVVLRTIVIMVDPVTNAVRFLFGQPPLSSMSRAASYYFTAVAVATFVILIRRWLRSTPTARRILTPVLAAALLLAGVEMVSAAVNLVKPTSLAWANLGFATSHLGPTALFYAGVVAKLAVPIAFLFGMARSRIERSGVGDLVIELGSQRGVGLRDALARTLHDPSVEIVYRLPSRDEFVDVAGRPASLLPEGSTRAITMVERAGEPLAAINHDRSLLDEPALIEAAAAAVRLAIDNERLQAEVRAKLEEVEASRARILEAGDEERRRVERNLHDGAQQRLVSVSLALSLLRERMNGNAEPELTSQLDAITTELEEALQELRELARGIHPAILTEEGLAAAVESLTLRSPVPVSIEGVSVGRLPEAVEATAYFVVAEALTNVAKYAHAGQASVALVRERNRLRVDVVDDGVGGAQLTAGSGLRGLEDRVAALSGTLSVQSDPGAGTRIRAEIPCDGR